MELKTYKIDDELFVQIEDKNVVCTQHAANTPARIDVYHIAYTLRLANGLYRKISMNFDTKEARTKQYYRLKHSKRVMKINSLWQTKYNLNGGF